MTTRWAPPRRRWRWSEEPSRARMACGSSRAQRPGGHRLADAGFCPDGAEEKRPREESKSICFWAAEASSAGKQVGEGFRAPHPRHTRPSRWGCYYAYRVTAYHPKTSSIVVMDVPDPYSKATDKQHVRQENRATASQSPALHDLTTLRRQEHTKDERRL